MAYNPITGEFESGGESYDVNRAQTGMAMTGMEMVGADIPLAFRIMENVPGITAMSMFNARRFANTMFKGGFLDVANGTPASPRQLKRAQKFGSFANGVAQRPSGPKSFLFGRSRDAQTLSTKTPFFKQSRINNFTLRPRAFSRFSSVTALSGVPNQGFYTPFQGTSILESMFGNRARQKAIAAGTLPAGSEERMFSGGVLGRMSTMSRAYGMEQKQARLLSKGTVRSQRKAAKISSKLQGLDQNLTRLGVTQEAVTAARAKTPGAGFKGSSTYIPDASTGRLKQISDTSSGLISRSITEYMGTMLDPSQFKGTKAFAALERNIISAIVPIDDGAMNIAAGQAAKGNVAKYLAGETVDDLGKFGVKSLSKLSATALSSGQRAVAAKLAGAAGARALGLTMPGLNVIGTASVVYDLTKLAATGVVAAGNFAKEAVKSMQGSINKPIFGMGFKDNEVAATSRARGVMAIQNSRLNARSSLGSEASMMAAHFG